MIHADPTIDHSGARFGARRLRLHRARLLVGLAALLCVGGIAATLLLVHGARTAAPMPKFVAARLGAAGGGLGVHAPARGVTVRLGTRGYVVSTAGASVGIDARGVEGSPWSSRAHGAARTTSFGAEAIVVGSSRTEELLTVGRHEGRRVWRWRVRGRSTPVVARDGRVLLLRHGRASAMSVAPVQILDAAGKTITPRAARWTVRHVRGGSWLLQLRLDDSKLPVPYVIDPATDYPSPLYLSSTASTESGSWRLVTSAPSAANTATNNTPGQNTTGSFLFRPGAGSTVAGTPATNPAGTGFVQDFAGGTGFPAGSWSFAVRTQIPSASLIAGSAILTIGVWKGTISNKGNFNATQTILPPTDDPAAQNIRAALTQTTTVTYSLPAFALGSTERLYVEIWRKQTAGINSATAADREVQLVVNNGVSQITHPAADDTPPANAFSVVNKTGGVYFTNPGGATGTIYYRGSTVGSFQLQDAASDAGSGVKQVTYPSLSTAGWSHAAQTVTSAPAYQSSAYSWAAASTNSPGAQAIVATDNAANASTGTPLAFTNDSTEGRTTRWSWQAGSRRRRTRRSATPNASCSWPVCSARNTSRHWYTSRAAPTSARNGRLA